MCNSAMIAKISDAISVNGIERVMMPPLNCPQFL